MVFEESVVVSAPFDEVVSQVKDAFGAAGFGTLSEIDVQATLRAKTGKQIERYVILGMCNPELAGRALDIVPEVGVLLPCNVVARQTDNGVAIDAMDPEVMPTLAGAAELEPIAAEARELINRAFEQLTAQLAE